MRRLAILAVQFALESVSSLRRNHCPVSRGIGVQISAEYAVQSSVYEIVNDKPVLAGIVAAKTKVAYRTKPGTRLFMTLGENADFMTADLQPNKTYYAYVAPRMGAWKARFVFEPKTAKDLESAEFKSDFETCKWVEVSDESLRWLSENMSSIQSKRTEYYQDWLKQPANERSRLLANDGK